MTEPAPKVHLRLPPKATIAVWITLIISILTQIANLLKEEPATDVQINVPADVQVVPADGLSATRKVLPQVDSDRYGVVVTEDDRLVTVKVGDLLSFEVPDVVKDIVWKVYPQCDWETVNADHRMYVQTSEAIINVEHVVVVAGQDDKKTFLKTFVFVVQGARPPPPDVDPVDPPKPDDTVGPVQAPDEGLRVLIVEESSKRNTAGDDVVASLAFRKLLNDSCKQNELGKPEWRVWDTSEPAFDVSAMPDIWKKMVDATKIATRPSILLVNKNRSILVDMPTSLEEATALVNRFK